MQSETQTSNGGRGLGLTGTRGDHPETTGRTDSMTDKEREERHKLQIMLAALHTIHANAAESVEWIRRVAGAAISKAEGTAT